MNSNTIKNKLVVQLHIVSFILFYWFLLNVSHFSIESFSNWVKIGACMQSNWKRPNCAAHYNVHEDKYYFFCSSSQLRPSTLSSICTYQTQRCTFICLSCWQVFSGSDVNVPWLFSSHESRWRLCWYLPSHFHCQLTPSIHLLAICANLPSLLQTVAGSSMHGRPTAVQTASPTSVCPVGKTGRNVPLIYSAAAGLKHSHGPAVPRTRQVSAM